MLSIFNSLSPNRIQSNFSCRVMRSYVWYSMEKLAGDLLLELKSVKLEIIATSILIDKTFGP